MMQKFEYNTTPSVGSDMKKMGEKGWELVAIENAVMWWKRAMEDGEPVAQGETVHDRIHQTLVDIRGHLMSQADKDAAAAKGGDKTATSNQLAASPMGKTEPAPHSESTASTVATMQSLSGGTAEALPSKYTPATP